MRSRPHAAALAALAALVLATACSGGGGSEAGTFAVASGTRGTARPTTQATVPAGRLRPPAAARLFAGSRSVVGALTRYCKNATCMEQDAGSPSALEAPAGSFAVFSLGETPVEAVAEVRVGAREKPATLVLNPGTLMVFNHGLTKGRYLVDLVVRWRSSEARWRFSLQLT